VYTLISTFFFNLQVWNQNVGVVYSSGTGLDAKPEVRLQWLMAYLILLNSHNEWCYSNDPFKWATTACCSHPTQLTVHVLLPFCVMIVIRHGYRRILVRFQVGGREFFHDIVTPIASSHTVLSYLGTKMTVDLHLMLRIILLGAVPLFSCTSRRGG